MLITLVVALVGTVLIGRGQAARRAEVPVPVRIRR